MSKLSELILEGVLDAQVAEMNRTLRPPMPVICRFSCGAASAVATKLTLATADPKDVDILNVFIKEEHADNRRFLNDCAKWFGHDITVLQDRKYGASTDEVWKRKRYMVGMRNAPCSVHLKHDLLDNFVEEMVCDNTSIKIRQVFGFTVEEIDRFERFRDNHRLWTCEAPLIDQKLTKSDCLAIIDRAGIQLPITYRMGYDNANCIGCPKGGQNYWQAIRADFPERFVQVQTIQDEIGPGAYFLRFRSGPRKNERMPLSELPAGRGNMADEPSFSCSFFCEMAEDKIK